MNVIARLEYELAYYDSAVHRFNHYTTRTPLVKGWGKYLHWFSFFLTVESRFDKAKITSSNQNRFIMIVKWLLKSYDIFALPVHGKKSIESQRRFQVWFLATDNFVDQCNEYSGKFDLLGWKIAKYGWMPREVFYTSFKLLTVTVVPQRLPIQVLFWLIVT